jgi:subtilisin-like proprotein convertase family protein
LDEDGACAADDCDDDDALRFPDAMEECNAVDDNCDGAVDEAFDLDGDGMTTCGPYGVADTGDEDCDDDEPLLPGGLTVEVPGDGDGTPLPDPSTTDVTALVELGEVVITDLDVRINLTHTDDSDLRISLSSPAATTIDLSDENGGSGADYIDTVFDDEADTAIGAGSAPFTGTFIPDAPLSTFDGEAPDGTWQLSISDIAGGDSGTFNNWDLIFTVDWPPTDQRDLRPTAT